MNSSLLVIESARSTENFTMEGGGGKSYERTKSTLVGPAMAVEVEVGAPWFS
jgi:hypothetical protein